VNTTSWFGGAGLRLKKIFDKNTSDEQVMPTLPSKTQKVLRLISLATTQQWDDMILNKVKAESYKLK
jgi:hypothetical protein